MTVRELIEALAEHDPSKEVTVFTRGVGFPTLEVKDLKDFGMDKVEIGCGWKSIPEDEEADWG
jgi:uncharacterized Fe-S cluster-containing radical SAM superfamily enzyme